ncbi:Uncharacterized protein Adt_20125 [Abeliophyllum distichum]|uniref:Uncharacterized protein n=1 Tax=Abeliophyllum distichum TaxID=126358 RepID=A0ABD1SVN0_9LAMI
MKHYTGRLCPKILRKLAKDIAIVDSCTIDWLEGPQYQVKSPSGRAGHGLGRVGFVPNPNPTQENRFGKKPTQPKPPTGFNPTRPGFGRVGGLSLGQFAQFVEDAVIRYTKNEPEDYVDNCCIVEAYLQCYNNIVLPINGKEIWPVTDCHIKAPKWIVPRKGRQQMKRRRQADEDFISQSQGQSKLKRKGQVIKTCSECGLQGHNKRYHLRPDAPSDEWYNATLHSVGNEMETPIGARTKLVPKKGSEGPSTEAQQ